MHNVDFEKYRKEIDTIRENKLKEQGKVIYKPKVDCCTHYNTDTFTVGYQANPRTGKISKFKVYICDNCGEGHGAYSGIKGLLSVLYFKFISKGCVFVPYVEPKEEQFSVEIKE